MKILMVHNKYQIPGGEGQTFERESRLLEQYNHQVYRYTRANQEISNNISRFEAGLRAIWSKEDYSKICQVIEEFKPDLIHIHNFFPLISPAIHHAAKTKVPVVQTLQNYRLWCLNGYFIRNQSPCEICLNQPFALPGIFYKCYRDSYAQSSAVALMQASHRLLRTWQNKVDRYIVTTDFFKQKAIQGGLPSHKIFIKPNFVSPDPGESFSKDNFLLYVGRLSPEKGIQMLVSVWMNYPDLPPIKFIGKGPMENVVQKASHQLSTVEYLGQLPSEQVYEWMGRAKALVFPSQWYEGLPLTIVESFAKGTPVIASRLGAMESLICHHYSGLHFEPGNIEDMVRQIRWLDDHPKEWLIMRKNARQEFEAKFTAEKNYQMLMAIYQQAIDQVK